MKGSIPSLLFLSALPRFHLPLGELLHSRLMQGELVESPDFVHADLLGFREAVERVPLGALFIAFFARWTDLVALSGHFLAVVIDHFGVTQRFKLEYRVDKRPISERWRLLFYFFRRLMLLLMTGRNFILVIDSYTGG